MGYHLTWLLENRILLISYKGMLTKADLYAYLAETMDMRDRANALHGEVGPLVHTITDASRMTGTELNLKEALKSLDAVRKQRVGWTIYIAAGKMDLFFASLGHQFAGVRFRCVGSVAEGIDFLKQMDDTLAEFTYVN
jgi:hypothetical protein